MAGGFPIGLQWGRVVDNSVESNVSAAAGTNTKGSYVQLIASTSSSGGWLRFRATASGTARSFLFDIAVGAGGSEVVIVPNLMLLCSSTAYGRSVDIAIPVSIPAGSRISARCQSTIGSASAFVSVSVYQDLMGSASNYGLVDTYNASTATSLATNSVDPGATISTKGAYAQITAATSRDYCGFFLTLGPNSTTTGALTTPYWSLDIAVGGAGSEIIIVPDIELRANTTSAAVSNTIPANSWFFPIPIPAGSRIAARAQCNGNAATVRLLGVVFHGVP